MTEEGPPNVTWHAGHLSRQQRWDALGCRGATVWFTGLSGSGKSTLAMEVEARLVRTRRIAYVLDGDNLRHGLNADLGFSPEDRTRNVRRVAEVARLFADAGAVALVSLISPFRAGRDEARQLHSEANLAFFEVWVDAPLEVCAERDPKGLYARARAGTLSGLTGVESPYEPPRQPDLVIRSDQATVGASAEAVLALLGGVGG
ncbi:MAG TPA: adenylyl-sulfate kinase [Acidimicrobiales bacterium]|nr:adenylyl-sulfate kinase [Acidimicrobiales bacterium]